MTLQDEIALVLKQCEMTAARADALPPNYTKKPTIAEWRERVTWLSDVLKRTWTAWNDVRKTRHGGNVGTTPFYLFPYQCEPEYDQGHWVVVWYDDLYNLANPRNLPPAAAPDAPKPDLKGVAMDTFPARQRLLTALATMPEEAFGWLVVVLLPKGTMPHISPWPDGLGGFMEASRAAITETQAAAKAYIEGDGK